MSGQPTAQRGGDRKPFKFHILTEVCCFLPFSVAYSYFIMQAKWWLLITHWHIFNCINSSNETILKWSSIQTLVGLASCIFRSSCKATLERETQAPPPTLWIKYTGALINTAMVKILQVVKNPPAKAGELLDTGLIPGSERSPGG